jgi:hypothetical protein
MSKRKHLQNIMFVMYQHGSQFDYGQIRPMQLIRYTKAEFYKALREERRFISDCSETITAAFKWAGFKDPNGLSYNGSGNSETMLNHLRNFFRARFANIGTIVHFDNPEHVAVVCRASRIRGNPMLWEHGRPGIAIIPLSEEKAFHNGRVTFLSIAKL